MLINLFKFLISISLCIVFLTSCATLNFKNDFQTRVQASNNKLPRLKPIFNYLRLCDCNKSTLDEFGDLFITNICDTSSNIKTNGYAVWTFLDKKSKTMTFGLPVYTSVFLIPFLFGMPAEVAKYEYSLQFEIKDLNFNTIYTKEIEIKSSGYKALYWGYRGNDFIKSSLQKGLIESSIKIIPDIQKQAQEIKFKLSNAETLNN